MAERLNGIVLRVLRVRPIRDIVERASWDGLVEAHHCLGFRSPFGAALRHVAELLGREWAALLGWSPGAFKVGARERWLGWLPERQFRREVPKFRKPRGVHHQLGNGSGHRPSGQAGGDSGGRWRCPEALDRALRRWTASR